MTEQLIPLSRGLFARIDEEDIGLVIDHKWYAVEGGHTFYAASTPGQISMHRLLLGAPDDAEVDHEDGDGLHNCRRNLRLCTHAQNLYNQRKQDGTSSRFKGVWEKEYRWHAQIEQDGVSIHLGSYESEIAAAKQYDRAARLFFGKFARTNEALGLFVDAPDIILSRPQRRRPIRIFA